MSRYGERRVFRIEPRLEQRLRDGRDDGLHGSESLRDTTLGGTVMCVAWQFCALGGVRQQ